jgi:hypothetical protein
MSKSAAEHKIESAKENLLDAVEALAELGWGAERIRLECEYALNVAVDDGLLEQA